MADSDGNVIISTYKENRPNGDKYVWEKRSIYIPEKKYNKILSRKLLGKIPKGESEMIPTRPKRESRSLLVAGDEKQPAVSAKAFHSSYFAIIKHVCEKSGVREQVVKILRGNKGLQQKLLTTVWFDFASDGDTWPGIVPWSTKHQGSLPYVSPISEDMYHDLFVELGRSVTARQKLFDLRARAYGTSHLLALDSTTVETFSENIGTARSAPHKDTLIKNVYKVVMFYSIDARQPVAYAKIPGNISDMSTVSNAVVQLRSLDMRDVEFVADSGYCSDLNMGTMLKSGFEFIMHIPSDTRWVSSFIEKHREELIHSGTVLQCEPEFSFKTLEVSHKLSYERLRGSAKKGLEKGDIELFDAKLHLFIYYSSLQKGIEDKRQREKYSYIRDDLLKGVSLDPADKKYCEKYMLIQTNPAGEVIEVCPNHPAFIRQSRLNGFIVLVASKEKDADLCLTKYRRREYIEEGMKNYKGHTGGDRPRKWSDETLDGQLLVQFLSLSMHESFESMLRYLKQTLALPTGEAKHDKAENIRIEKSLRNWIRKTSLHRILDWFSAVDYNILSRGNSKYHQPETLTQRDRLFLSKIGISDN